MKFRRAQHTSDLKKIVDFYTHLLGMVILGEFHDHDGYNGVFLGFDYSNWELEFTENGATLDRTSDPDDLLVFYPKDQIEFNVIRDRVYKFQIPLFEPTNPYWKINGICILDPDGFRIVISRV